MLERIIRPKVITQWGQRNPTSILPQRMNSESTLFIHYSASDGSGINTKGEPKQAVRNIQNFHMDGNGWSDIGYSWVLVQQRGIFKRPLLFKGRGFDRVPASQMGWNTGNGSVCVIADSNDPIKRSTTRALRYVARRCPAQRVKGHRDVNATDCPGDKLYSKVPAIDAAARTLKLAPMP